MEPAVRGISERLLVMETRASPSGGGAPEEAQAQIHAHLEERFPDFQWAVKVQMAADLEDVRVGVLRDRNALQEEWGRMMEQREEEIRGLQASLGTLQGRLAPGPSLALPPADGRHPDPSGAETPRPPSSPPHIGVHRLVGGGEVHSGMGARTGSGTPPSPLWLAKAHPPLVLPSPWHI